VPTRWEISGNIDGLICLPHEFANSSPCAHFDAVSEIDEGFILSLFVITRDSFRTSSPLAALINRFAFNQDLSSTVV